MLFSPNLRIVDSEAMPWQPSPSKGVWRRRLEVLGDPERGRVTSIVRYDPKSSFPSHAHPEGEEIYVIDGVFSDDEGDYPAGTVLLNPPGSRHAPRSKGGCVLFVKLRYYGGEGRPRICIDTNIQTWQSTSNRGVHRLPVYQDRQRGEGIDLLLLDPGADLPVTRGGRELLVIAGGLVNAEQRLHEGAWILDPGGAYPLAAGPEGATIYARRGHIHG